MPVANLEEKKEALMQVYKSVSEDQNDEGKREKAIAATLELYIEIAQAKMAIHELPKAQLDISHDSYKEYLEKAKANEVTSAIDEISQFISKETKIANVVTPLSKSIVDAFSLLKASTIPVLMSFEFQTHANFVRSCLRNQSEPTMQMYYDLTLARMRTKTADNDENILKRQFNAFSTVKEDNTNKKMRM